MARKKAVISADPEALADVEALVRSGRYATVSAFMREAIAENLARVRHKRLAEQVARYCASGGKRDDDEDSDLIAGQAFSDSEGS